ncbi:MAG: hypothetical protein WA110_02300 [Anaerolineaceae bacterium]
MADNPDPSKHRHSIRLPEFDYSQAGTYFVTIVTQGRRCSFGEVVGVEMVLNDVGRMAEQVCQEFPRVIEGIEGNISDYVKSFSWDYFFDRSRNYRVGDRANG